MLQHLKRKQTLECIFHICFITLASHSTRTELLTCTYFYLSEHFSNTKSHTRGHN